MSSYTYVGILEPAFAADRFVTSIFADAAGDYYTQEDDENESIINFKPIRLTRNLKSLGDSTKIEVNIGDRFVYSFQTSSNQLIFGQRAEIEKSLLQFINADGMTAHARLMISSFLKLYQKTIDLVNESNEELEKIGISQKLDTGIAFSNTTEPSGNTNDLVAAIRSRYEHFYDINKTIRLEDIAFMDEDNAFFSHHHIRLDSFANRHSLQNDESNKLVSELIMICAEKNRSIIRALLMRRTETADFLLGTEYITIDQEEADAPLIQNEDNRRMPRSMSVIETFIRIDKEIYSEGTTPKKKKKAIDEKTLWSSFESIVADTFAKSI